jgi:hypothetical protein
MKNQHHHPTDNENQTIKELTIKNSYLFIINITLPSRYKKGNLDFI